ncbi:MAG: hypothetical protein P1S59_12000 [bacterium]|nr:hypothetical protein [bacterium]
MILGRRKRIAPVSLYCSGYDSGYRRGIVPMSLVAGVLLLFSTSAFGSWSQVDEILTEAYGAQTARECSDYYSTLNIPDDQVAAVRGSIARLVEAGYPSGCPWEYLKLAADLSKAGIDLDDLTNKIREGIAKKVSPERLTRVIDDRVKALLEARVFTLKLVENKIKFLDRQMAYSVIADYLLRGVSQQELMASILEGKLEKYPALDSVIN